VTEEGRSSERAFGSAEESEVLAGRHRAKIITFLPWLFNVGDYRPFELFGIKGRRAWWEFASSLLAHSLSVWRGKGEKRR